MKLRDVKHEEMFCGEKMVDNFNIHNNRFVLFDKSGRQLNGWAVEEIPNYLEIEVLETKKSGYQSYVYFVGFPTTHIKLDILNDDLCWGTLKFGEVEEDRSC